jgi:AraC family transcriptional regulator of adaptative response / methylphosphotriester-DNA alkyltransferase methyltransferase
MKQLTEDEMFEAVVNNDANYDGLFFYTVKSTGIFCRPSCPSRKPNRDNVEFFTTAMEAGYRPCKRCRSDLLTYHPMAEIASEMKDHMEALYQKQANWNDRIIKLGISKRRVTDIFKET